MENKEIKSQFDEEKQLAGDVNYEVYMKHLASASVMEVRELRVEMIKRIKVWKRIFAVILLPMPIILLSFAICSGGLPLPLLMNGFGQNVGELNGLNIPTVLMILTLVIFLFCLCTLIAYNIACQEKKVLIIEDYLKYEIKQSSNELTGEEYENVQGFI